MHIGTSKTGDIAYSPMMHSSWREGTLEITMIMLMLARASFLNEIKDLLNVLNVINLSYFFRCYSLKHVIIQLSNYYILLNPRPKICKHVTK